MKTDDGSVRLKAGVGSEIDARVSTVGWRIAPGEVTVTESQTGDRVDIEVRLPKDRPGWGTGHPSITVTLRVPKQADLSVHAGDGSIRATGLSGQLEAETGDSRIVLDKPLKVAGTISPNTVRGELGAGGLPLQIHTGDGSIRLMGV